MTYDLIDLRYSSNPKDCCYFFDSNILLPILGLPNSRQDTENYLKYFKSVYMNCLSKPELKIYTCTNQLSEIFNILMSFEMKKIYGDEQKKDYPDIKRFFKEVFRPSENYLKKFELYKQEFLNYAEVFKIMDLGNLPLNELLDFNVKVLDFNDQVILQCVGKAKAILVTDDKDFYGYNITQATFNTSLIKRFKDQPVKVKPKL